MSEELPLPKSVKVACFVIRLENWHSHSATANHKYGEFSSIEQAIRIDLSAAKMNVVNTLIHELLHAVYWAYSIRDADEEKRTVETMATGLQQVLMDNKELKAYLFSML